MNDDLLVGIDEYRVLNEENPIAYTRDVTTCVVCLIHRQNDSVLMHIEAFDYSMDLDNFLEIVGDYKENPITLVEIFKGQHTSLGSLSILKFMLHKINVPYEIHDVFKNTSNETSVGYNYETKDYYGS